MKLRTGIGIDAHRFEAGRPLMLGCVEVEHELGLAGHSDADVLSHAIADALLGAAGLEDIGHYFPDSDFAWKDLAGDDLLGRVADLLRESGCRIGNIDAVVACEEPKVAPHRERMRHAVAEALGVELTAVTLRGTTTEGMGFTGRSEGIAAFATCLLECGEE